VCNLNSFVDVGLRMHKTTQLNHALERFDVDFSPGSAKMAALTFVVIVVSSTNPPVPSCFAVDAQPNMNSMVIAIKNLKRL